MSLNYRVLAFMLLGGAPGVLIGSLLFRRVAPNTAVLYWILGAIIVVSSLVQIAGPFLRKRSEKRRKNRMGWVSLVMLPIGTEVGLSSSGAGALGTVALLNLTDMPAHELVGTDILFGLCVALVGSGVHFAFGAYDGALLLKLSAGGIAGALVGVSVAPLLPNKHLRLALACWLLLIGADFCLRAASL